MISQNDTYTLPPEWSPQSGAMLTWPHIHSDWKQFLITVEPVYIEIAREISKREKLIIVCYDNQHRTHIKKLFSGASIDASGIEFTISQSNDTWARDHGPITVYKNKTPVLLDFEFNGWGKKYACELDNGITENLVQSGILTKATHKKPGIVLEGGSIEVNGRGEMLTTTRCLLSNKRNPDLNQTQLEEKLHTLFNLKQIYWLDHGYLSGDDTDSHIDTLARFCNDDTIVYTSCDNKNDEHYQELKLMEEELRSINSKHNKQFNLIPLTIPDAIYNDAGERLPANYANFFIINGAVLVPVYGDKADINAVTTLKACFPQREIVTINCLPLIQQYGSLHCITMQFPDGVF